MFLRGSVLVFPLLVSLFAYAFSSRPGSLHRISVSWLTGGLTRQLFRDVASETSFGTHLVVPVPSEFILLACSSLDGRFTWRVCSFFSPVPLLFRVLVRLRARTFEALLGRRGQSFGVGLVLCMMLWHSTLSLTGQLSRAGFWHFSECRHSRWYGVCDLMNARFSTQALSPVVSRERIARTPVSLTVMASSTSSNPPCRTKAPLALVPRFSDGNGVGVGLHLCSVVPAVQSFMSYCQRSCYRGG